MQVNRVTSHYYGLGSHFPSLSCSVAGRTVVFCIGSQSVSRMTLLSLSLGTLNDSDKILVWQSAYEERFMNIKCIRVHLSTFFIWTCICMYIYKQKPPRLQNCTTEDIPQLIWRRRTLWKLCPCSCSTQNSQYDLSGTILASPLGTTTLVSVDLHKTPSLSPDHWHDRPKELQSIVSMCT